MTIIIPDKRILTRQPQGFFDVDRSSELLGNKTNVIVGSNSAIDVGSKKPFSTRTADIKSGSYGLEYYGTPSQTIATPNVSDGSLPLTMAAIFNGYVSSSAGPVYYFGQRWSGGLTAIVDCWDTTIGNFRTFSTGVTDGVYNFLVATITESRLISFYVNGSLVGSVTAGNTQSDSAPESVILFDTSTVYGRCPLLVKTNRAWTAAQVKAWQTNPWQVFSKPKTIVYSFSASSGAQTVTGSNGSLDLTSTNGAITQVQTVTGSNCSLVLTSNNGVITQTEVTTGSNGSLDLTSTNGAIVQTEITTGSNCSLGLTSTNGAITVGGVNVTGSNCSLGLTSTNGAITQTEVTTGSNGSLDLTSTNGAVIQTEVTTGSNCSLGITSTSGAISGPTTQTVTGSNCSLALESTSGSIGDKDKGISGRVPRERIKIVKRKLEEPVKERITEDSFDVLFEHLKPVTKKVVKKLLNKKLVRGKIASVEQAPALIDQIDPVEDFELYSKLSKEFEKSIKKYLKMAA